jgi:hypothetical protein
VGAKPAKYLKNFTFSIPTTFKFIKNYKELQTRRMERNDPVLPLRMRSPTFPEFNVLVGSANHHFPHNFLTDSFYPESG